MSDLYRMPSLGSDMESATLIEWCKQPGERLAKDDVIAVVETQKGAIEIEVFHDAVMGKPLIEVGETVPVGAAMAELEGIGDGIEQAPSPPVEPPAPSGRRRASPAARRLAEARGIGLERLRGSGPEGAIRLEDVQRAVQAQAPKAPLPPDSKGTGLGMAAMRQAIAAAMSRSKREIPHYYLSHDIDLTRATQWLGAHNAELPPDRRILMAALFIKAVALTLRKFPELNGFDRDGQFEPSKAIHVGSATAIRGGGLVAPAIHDADQLELGPLMDKLRDLVARVRRGGLRASELSDPTVTVSSLGERGVDRLYGVIYPPQVAIVGFGTPELRPRVVEGEITPRTLVTATLAADHRHSDGHRGGLFLAKLAARLQEPETL
ncbi:dihydrolipoamide acetyltransferase family protein [Thiorhodococcus minor]|uniref:Dihydrolipoamide acetyltransferase component of pyruvate dehydrogenase complex n=1 Tax=Thiorhodococcus minor TaxID=57489 RepID=A0A6M0JTJ4_9GAMM|nr:dihydrolipoamide acetyltransferase family protein [Thiorhodococcus minor]NEV60792.1 2-oxo acid dehydrogenase subunit E2 [Thiorhodococcus minor]